MILLAPFVYVNVQSWTDVLVLCVIMALAVYWMFNAGSPDNRVYTRQENTLGWIPFWSPLARELKRLGKKRKDEEKMKKLLRYGLGE